MTRSSAAGGARRAYNALCRLPLVAPLLFAASIARAQPYTVETRPNLAYGPLPEEVADLFLPATPARDRPAIVLIHGGGWIEGSRHTDDGLAAVIAKLGVVVLNIDYRLADRSRPDTRWPAQLVDAQLAVRFLRAHAAEYGVDGAHIGAMGDSAGGQLAVFLGVLPHSVAGDAAGLYPGEAPDVQAAVDQFGPMDLPGMGPGGAGSVAALFGSATPPASALLSASPLPSITAHSAPVYIVHGTADAVVPFDQSRRLDDALRAHGVTAKLVSYPGGHEYEGLTTDQAASLQVGAVMWLLAQLR